MLHACAHVSYKTPCRVCGSADSPEPTGIDPTEAQWKELSEIVKEKKHFPFFDMVSYQSIASRSSTF